MKKFSIIAFCLIVWGCSYKDPFVIDIPQVHPPIPSPIQPICLNLSAVEIDSEVKYVVNKKDYILLNKFLLDVSEYLEKIRASICFYQDKNSDLCQKR